MFYATFYIRLMEFQIIFQYCAHMKLTNSDREDILGILEKHGIPTAEVLFHKKKGRIFIKTSAKDFHFSYFLKKSSFSDALGNNFQRTYIIR